MPITADSDRTPTACSQCGQALYLRTDGRDRCERCRLGRTEQAGQHAAAAESSETAETVVDRAACAGCGRTQTEQGGFPLALADGYCLSCRVRGAGRRP